MGPRGPPGPAGAPVSVESFPLGGVVNAHHLQHGSTVLGPTWCHVIFPFRALKDFKALPVNLASLVFL